MDKGTYNMKDTLYIEIEADTNDADYITRRETITQEEIEILRPALEAVSKFKNPRPGSSHNWPTGDRERKGESLLDFYGTEEEKELYGDMRAYEYLPILENRDPDSLLHSIFRLDEYVPYGEYGVHTIENIQIMKMEIVESF